MPIKMFTETKPSTSDRFQWDGTDTYKLIRDTLMAAAAAGLVFLTEKFAELEVEGVGWAALAFAVTSALLTALRRWSTKTTT